MSGEERLQQQLRALRELDAAMQAPEPVEARLRTAFRAQHARNGRPALGWLWAPALAASLAAGAFVWRANWVAVPPSPPMPSVAFSTPSMVVRQVEATHASAPRPVRRASQRQVAPPPAVEFSALPFAPPLDPTEPAQVIRVRVPRQSIRSLGLPVDEERLTERVPAELILGQDGIARGIRFVSTGTR